MPFEILETITKQNAAPTAKLSYLRHVRKGKEMDRSKVKPNLTVTMPTTICLSKAEKFQIFIGSGVDSGKLRICGLKKGVPGGVKAKEFKTHIILRFGYVPTLGDEIFDKVECAIVRVDTDTYDLTVPSECLPAPVAKGVKAVA